MARVQDNYKTLKKALSDAYTMDRLKLLGINRLDFKLYEYGMLTPGGTYLS